MERYRERETVLSVSSFRESKGQVFVTRLSRADEYENGTYSVWYGKGNEESAPLEQEELKLVAGNMSTCFDVTMLTSEIIVVDCAVRLNGEEYPISNEFYVMNISRKEF